MAEIDSIELEHSEFDGVTVAVDSLPKPVDFTVLFGNTNPVEMEIGSGKAAFLLRMARTHPDRNFVGIEWASQYYRFAADRMVRWGVKNVRMIRTDAKNFVLYRLAPACLTALHVYHPDPWPKRRHHKRRLFSADFVEAAVRALISGGRWAIQTDHRGYYEVIKQLTQTRPELEAIPFNDPAFGTIGERTETNFELKYLREGRAIYRLAYRRK